MIELEPRLNAYRRAVADAIKVGVPELRDVKVHVGSFNGAALQKFSLITPAARVSFLGMRGIRRNNVGQMIGPCLMSVFVMDKDPISGEVYSPALHLAEKVADFIDMNDFGLSYAACADVNEVEPIISEEIDKMGCAIANVTFSQEVTIGRDRHQVEEHELYPVVTDPEVQAAGWPQFLQGMDETTIQALENFGEQTLHGPGFEKGYGKKKNK